MIMKWALLHLGKCEVVGFECEVVGFECEVVGFEFLHLKQST